MGIVLTTTLAAVDADDVLVVVAQWYERGYVRPVVTHNRTWWRIRQHRVSEEHIFVRSLRLANPLPLIHNT